MRLAAPPIAAGLILACSAGWNRPIHYRNQDPDPVWIQGMEAHHYRSDSLEFEVGFIEPSDEVLAFARNCRIPLSFQLEIHNLGQTPALIDPARFVLTIPVREDTLARLDPEAAIRDVRADIAMQRFQLTEHCGPGFFDFIDGTVSLFVDTPQAQEEKTRAADRDRADCEGHQNAVRGKIGRLSGEERYWTEIALRKHTLAPGAALQGTLSFVLPRAGAPDSLSLGYAGASGNPFALGHFRLDAK